MKTKKISQNELDQLFLKACEEQNLPIIKELDEKYPIVKETKFKSFLKLFGYKENPVLNVHCNNSKGLIDLGKLGNMECLEYLSKHHSFFLVKKSQTNKESNELLNSLFQEVNNRNTTAIESLASLVENSFQFTFHTYEAFNDACADGDLDTVKFILLNDNFPNYSLLNSQYDEFHQLNKGFINACESGNLALVEFLTSSPELDERVNLRLIEDTIFIQNTDILVHFVFDLNLPKTHNIFNHLNVEHDQFIKELFHKKELFLSLNKELADKKIEPKQKLKI